MAVGSLGDAYASLRVETKKVPGDVKEGLRRASADAEEVLDGIGENWGEHLADSTSDELGKHGRDFGDAISKAIDHEVIHIRGRKFKIDRHGMLHDAAGLYAGKFVDEMEGAFDRLIAGGGRGGGPFGRIGQAMADAIGAGFNVSGKSPLIAFLVPAIGSIVGLVLGAIQGVQSLIAVFTTLPALIASIGIQVGVLGIAFGNLGKAINVILNADTIEDIDEVLKDIQGLTPESIKFVKSFIPLRELFKDIKEIVRSNFFKNIGDPLGVVKFLTPSVVRGFGQVATEMGKFFAQLGIFFNSPTFINFVRDVFPATALWIQQFGPAFISILGALIGMADQAMPFLEHLGNFISLNLTSLARNLNDVIRSGGFKQWLANMFHTFELLAEVFGQFIKFVATFMVMLDRAGGDQILVAIADAVERIGLVLASPAGLKAMEGLVDVTILSIKAFAGLIIAIFAVLGFLEVLGESLNKFWKWITTVVGPALGDFFSWLGGRIGDFFTGITHSLVGAQTAISTAMNQMVTSVRGRITDAVDFIRSLPAKAQAALGNIGNLLYNAGRSLLQGFINGIRSKLGDLADTAKSAIHTVTDWFPGSPAEKGPLSGEGYALYRGQRMAEDFGQGMRQGFGQLQTGLASDLGAMVSMLQPSTSTSTGIVFGPGAVKVTFEGVVPTEDEARRTGHAVGAGISDQLAKRNTVLAVRTL